MRCLIDALLLKRWGHARLVEERGVEEVVEALQEDFKGISGEYSISQQVASRKTLQYIQRGSKPLKIALHCLKIKTSYPCAIAVSSTNYTFTPLV